MFKIGEFSKFTCVSIKQLRYYDELGLLKPRLVDPFTSYRYYSADQLPRLNRILALRDLGFGLEQIARLLDDDLSLEQMRRMLKLRRAEIEQQVREERARLARVEARLRQIEEAEEPAIPYDVVVRSLEPQLVAGVRARVRTGSDAIADLFDEVERFAASHRVRAASPPLMLYHDADFHEGEQEVEVMVPLAAPAPGKLPVAVRTLEGYSAAACTIHTGGYEQLTDAFATLLRWIEHNEYAIAGPLREVYLRFSATPDGYDVAEAFLANKTAEFVTELQLPVAKDG
ncbi:MAG: MerR family transcriptional regulator [Chloroflexi bacterium]|nr:MAG: MerR family transcriptional regulator [Chloroflexota bacterium]